jgi:fumarylacetoacetase
MTASNGASWVEAANEADGGFPLDNLPWCVFAAENGRGRPGVRIGDYLLDLEHAARSGLLEQLPLSIIAACQSLTLNALMACSRDEVTSLRSRLQSLLDARADQVTQDDVSAALHSLKDVSLLKPVDPPNFTDFYASIDHATNVGRIFRPDNPLLPNYKFVPIGYHGRASSIVANGTPIRRPHGQIKPPSATAPEFLPTRWLDYELEVAIYIAAGNVLGEPIAIRDAAKHIFGVSLLNDWSARDIQSWEYQPLGPFLGKNFATSVSPYVVPMDALKPFRRAASLRTEGPNPLDYLWDATDQYTGAIDMTLEVFLLTKVMRNAGLAPHRLSNSNLRELYWTPAQLIAHHTSNGCNLLPGDLLGTGTVSGPQEDSPGCLLELTHGGSKPVLLPNGEARTSLEDGDEVILHGFCKREGFPRISLGECRGTVLPAQEARPSIVK